MRQQITTLDNGLTVITDAVDTVESASLGVWIGAGARYERPEANGVAHLLEHMTFKGTRKRSALDIAEEIESVGGQINAYTSRESTAFYARVLKDDVPLAVDVLADILQDSVFDEGELTRERSVILQEIAQAVDMPDDIVFDNFQSAAYPDQPLGRPVLGTADSVTALTRQSIADYLGEQYAGPRMVLSASGHVSHDVMLDLAHRLFADLPNQSSPPPKGAAYRGGEHREHRDLEQLQLVLGFGGVSYADPDFYALSVLSAALGGGMSSRLFQEVREKRGLAYAIYSFTNYYRDSGLFGIYCGTSGRDAAELCTVLCGELSGLTQTLTDADIHRAQVQLKANLLMGLESTMARCEQQANQWLMRGRLIEPAEIVEKLEAVDRADLTKAAERILATPPTMATLGPIAEVPPVDHIASRLG